MILHKNLREFTDAPAETICDFGGQIWRLSWGFLFFFNKIWTRISLLMLVSAQQSTVWWKMPNLWRKSSFKRAGCSAFSKEKTQPAFYLCCYRVLPFLFPNHCPDFQSIFLSNLSFPSFFWLSLDALFLSCSPRFFFNPTLSSFPPTCPASSLFFLPSCSSFSFR